MFAALKRPTVLELIGKIARTRAEQAELFAGHDGGDEDADERRCLIFVCRLGPGPDKVCNYAPHHMGPHEWERC